MDDSWNLDEPADQIDGKANTYQQKNQESHNTQHKEQQPAQQIIAKLDQSNWLSQQKQPIEQNISRPTRKNKDNSLQNTSFLQDIDPPIGQARELSREDPNTTWLNQYEQLKKKEESKAFSKDNRPQSQNQKNGAPRRGNRGDKQQIQKQAPRRGNRDDKQQDKQAPRRGNRNRQDRGNQQGDFRKKKDNQFHQPRQNQYDRGERGERGDRGGYRGGYRGRGRGGYNNNYNNYNNNHGQGGNRRYRPKDQGEQGFSNSQNRNTFGQKEQRNNRYEDRPSNNYYHNNRNYNNQNSYNNPRYQDNAPNQVQKQSNYSQNYKQVQHQKPTQVATSPALTTAQMIPKGRKCWPQTTLNILGCKVVLTCRHLTDFRCKLLVMPYSTVQMQYYPGNAINTSSIDYRKKIISKGSDINFPGAVYLQKAIEVYTFEAIAFVKIDQSQVQESLKIGIKQVIRLVQKIDKPISLQTLVFPICQELGNANWVVAPFLQHLENCRRVKQVWITTIQGPCYIKAAGAFNGMVEKMFKSNEILLN